VKTSFYVPDDLAARARRHGISVSEVARLALQKAVRDAEVSAESGDPDDTLFVARMLVNGLSPGQVVELVRILSDPLDAE
jgi:hypothetical protein